MTEVLPYYCIKESTMALLSSSGYGQAKRAVWEEPSENNFPSKEEVNIVELLRKFIGG
ncbi:hypothetical protein [Sediminibacillus massiliensis]|uniref:hypothetical protein n=1 Tax=Sediminibacillus massiliensis TaxID=1926277 RepID=UPI0015C3978E|nr:hypothetical protein [Sediminibacillus massiliensis]